MVDASKLDFIVKSDSNHPIFKLILSKKFYTYGGDGSDLFVKYNVGPTCITPFSLLIDDWEAGLEGLDEIESTEIVSLYLLNLYKLFDVLNDVVISGIITEEQREQYVNMTIVHERLCSPGKYVIPVVLEGMLFIPEYVGLVSDNGFNFSNREKYILPNGDVKVAPQVIFPPKRSNLPRRTNELVPMLWNKFDTKMGSVMSDFKG
tara:strand:- start:1795 stop:2409 length:615 start_codon:yes stop_codon:yes gene_type:complete